MKKTNLDKEKYWDKITKGWLWMFIICLGLALTSKFLLKSVFIMYFFFMSGLTSLLLYLLSGLFYHRYFIASRIDRGLSKDKALAEWHKKYD